MYSSCILSYWFRSNSLHFHLYFQIHSFSSLSLSLSPLSTAMATPDLLFGLRNNFYLGAYQVAINNSEISTLSPEDAIERDSLVYRSYIALGSYQVSLQSLCFSDLLKDPVNWLSFCLIWFSWWLMRLTRMHQRHFRLSSSSPFISLVQKIRFVFY